MGRKDGGAAVPLLRRARTPSNTMAWADVYFRTKWRLHPSSRLATTDIGQKLGRCSPLGEGKLGPHLTQSRLAQAYLHTKWHFDASSRLVTIKMGGKLGVCPLVGEERWGPI